MRPIFHSSKVVLPSGTTAKQAIAAVSRMIGSYKSGDLVLEDARLRSCVLGRGTLPWQSLTRVDVAELGHIKARTTESAVSRPAACLPKLHR
jgi:hypothetical protein